MSFYNFPGFSAPDTSFHPLFRLLDQFDQYQDNTGRRHHRSQMKTFNPKFDVKEVDDSYELHGELPGVEQKDIEIEFSDDHTLSIKGRTERSYQSGTPPAGFVEGPTASGAITESGEEHKDHKAYVEDEEAGAKDANTEVAKKDSEQPKEPQAKYWVSERSVGEFSRSFSFPVRVDPDAVKASMKNGILSIVVPKAKQQSSRKITIN
ncbi:HSP20-like chaperone [Mollisia scopiformis]|uniref:HSP20-like chaperone n=1 Tax=Mollisia scopiformis TaxID=149040 RepID=A0A194XRQ1_MOLSC|nr:HSP20-like chaperone [Mollisia scopiformis]KUJ22407.1 HSP20-like chaperone [Mollisia scopiformis]